MTKVSRFSFDADNAASAETRIKIIEAAEHLFGNLGIDGAPLRTVSAAAGQRNTNSVQYHFGNRYGLLTAIFEYRESQLDGLRGAMIEKGKNLEKIQDVRWLMRIMFEPNFRHYVEKDGIDYIKLHATYLVNVRPRGIQHPIDYDCPSTVHYREANQRLRDMLSFLRPEDYDTRLAAVGALFLMTLIRHHATAPEQRCDTWELFEQLIEMMVAAMTVPPWQFSLSRTHRDDPDKA